MAEESKTISQPGKTKFLIYFNQYFGLITSLTVILILGLAYFLLLTPLISKYQNLSQKKIVEQQEKLDAQQKSYNELYSLDETYQAISSSLKDKVAGLLPTQPNLPSFYYNLDQLVSAAGYKILSIDVEVPREEMAAEQANPTPSPPNQDLAAPTSENNDLEEGNINVTYLPSQPTLTKKLKKIKVILGLEGSGYSTLKKLLDLLEHNLRIIDVQSLSYNPEDLELSLSLDTYFY